MPERDTVRLNVTPEIVALAEREAKRGVRWRNGPVACLGLFGTLAGINFFADPASVQVSAIGRNLSGPWDEAWTLGLLIGGLLVVIGGLRPWQLIELFGWALYVPAAVVYAVAVVVISEGIPPATFYTLSAAAAGSAKIVYLLFYAPRSVRVRVERRRITPGGQRPYDGAERRG